MANNNDGNLPPITVTTTTSGPVTHTVTTTTRLGPRANRPNANNPISNDNAINNLQVPGPGSNTGVEPFPALPSPSPSATRQQQNDYFSQPPMHLRTQNTRPINIRRLPSATEARRIDEENELARTNSRLGLPVLGRRRTNTAPSQQRPAPVDSATSGLAALPGHYELGRSTSNTMEPIVEGEKLGGEPQRRGSVGQRVGQRLRSASNAARSSISRTSDERPRADYNNDIIDYLDVVDPEVSAMTTLTNIQNSLFVPDVPFLNRYINRQPTFELSRFPSRRADRPEPLSRVSSARLQRKPTPQTPEPPPVPPKDIEYEKPVPEEPEAEKRAEDEEIDQQVRRTMSITSHLDDEHYAVLPHGVTLSDWTDEDKEALDDYVRHMLHSRRSRFKRSMKAFGKYVRKPLGFLVTLYATLITLFGLAWVLFLIGWIYVGDRQNYIINIIDNVLVALFAIVGDGLAPFRAVDTYHMIYIAHYHRLSWRLRKQKQLPKLSDHNDLPERTQTEVCEDAEAGVAQESGPDWEFSVLTPEQQKKLVHHQNKFSKSHSYYRPHETSTHYAFPLKLLITIVSLLDLHSVLQISLGAFTWGWSYHTRPPAITAVILSCSITVNITAGIFISIGDRRTRKKDVLLRMARQDLTQEAMRKVEKQKQDKEGSDEDMSRENSQSGMLAESSTGGNKHTSTSESSEHKESGDRSTGEIINKSTVT